MHKKYFGPGPWQDEPDEASWTDESTGLPCRALRNGAGAWCGYVGVPPTHEFYRVYYSDIPYLPVHGGLTYSDFKGNETWWLGFDCGHYCDYVPHPDLCKFSGGIQNYRTLEFVKAECSRLAQSLV